MQGKVSMVVPILSSDYEILKTLDKHCFMVADIKPVAGKSILLEIEVFTILGSADIEQGGDYIERTSNKNN